MHGALVVCKLEELRQLDYADQDSPSVLHIFERSVLFILFVSLLCQAEPVLLLTPTNGVDMTDLKQASLQALHLLPQPLIHLFVVNIFTDSF